MIICYQESQPINELQEVSIVGKIKIHILFCPSLLKGMRALSMAFVHFKYKPHTKQEFSDLTHTGASQQKGPTLSDRIERVLISLTFPCYVGIVSHTLPLTRQPPKNHPGFFLDGLLKSESIKVSYLTVAEKMGTAERSVPAGTLHR